MSNISSLEQSKPKIFPSPKFNDWLIEIGSSIFFTTYQNSRVFIVSIDENEKINALERMVGSAMGLAVDKDKIWIANKDQIKRFANVGPYSFTLNETNKKYDAVYMPRQNTFIGKCDTHDILSDVEYNNHNYELLFVNTNFSCIASIDQHYNFVPVWKPSFISEIAHGDRCHLNGMCSKDGKLAYATACAQTDEALAWKKHRKDSGVLIDIQSNEIIVDNLSMPHSPRWYKNKLWLLNSGNGQFGYIENSQFVPITECAGYARGLSFIGDYAVIGLSKLRNTSFISDLKLTHTLKSANINEMCGLIIVDINTGKIAHWLSIKGSLSEIYDVAILPHVKCPYIPNQFDFESITDLINIAPTFTISKNIK